MRLLLPDSKILGSLSAAGWKLSLMMVYRHVSLQFSAKLNQKEGAGRGKECVSYPAERWERLKLACTVWECSIHWTSYPVRNMHQGKYTASLLREPASLQNSRTLVPWSFSLISPSFGVMLMDALNRSVLPFLFTQSVIFTVMLCLTLTENWPYKH